jgi:hypothetical protein
MEDKEIDDKIKKVNELVSLLERANELIQSLNSTNITITNNYTNYSD